MRETFTRAELEERAVVRTSTFGWQCLLCNCITPSIFGGGFRHYDNCLLSYSYGKTTLEDLAHRVDVLAAKVDQLRAAK